MSSFSRYLIYWQSGRLRVEREKYMDITFLERIIGDAANAGAIIAIGASFIKLVLNKKRRQTLLPLIIVFSLLAGTIFLPPYLVHFSKLSSGHALFLDLSLSALVILIAGLIFSNLQSMLSDKKPVLIVAILAIVVDLLMILLIILHGS